MPKDLEEVSGYHANGNRAVMPNGKLDLQAKFLPNRPASECEQIHVQNGKKAKVSSFMGFNLKTPPI